MLNVLAINGGSPTIQKTFPRYNTLGEEELVACKRVLNSGVLSQFLGCHDEDFYGGVEIKEFEKEWSEFFRVKHSVSVNSNTSGLMCAIGAIGIEPGDQVIVSPWSMCASATCILVWNAIPVFADIEAETFNLDPESVEKLINEKTKAIVVPDIFGHPADLKALMQLAEKHNLYLIEDAAQLPGVKYHNQHAGTVGHIGVYSLNYHKHIHTGEGGVCVTNDSILAEKMCLIRNHAEAVIAGRDSSDHEALSLANMIGFNFRLTELQAAIGREQLKKLPNLLSKKQKEVQYLTSMLNDLPGLNVPVVKPQCEHAYYCYPMVLTDGLEKKRDFIVEALQAEGVPGLSGGYINIHTYPMYTKRIAYGKSGFPWSIYDPEKTVKYGQGTCPVAEDLHNNSFMKLEICLYDFNLSDMELIAAAFKKVWLEMGSF
jgi:perosamine synthetase